VSKFVQNIISVRFMEVVEALIEKRIVNNLAQFCKKVDYPPQSMSQIKAGKRDVTIDLVSKLFNQYKGSPMYLLSGKGPKIFDDQTLSVVEEGITEYIPQTADRSTFRHLEDIINSKDKVITVYEEKITEQKDKIAELERQLKKVSR
jgi:hypothetical protein